MSNPAIVIFASLPKQELCHPIATQLIKKKIAACVKWTNAVNCCYEWQGKILEEKEYLLIIKTHQKHWEEIKITIEKVHPYDIPEITKISIEDSNNAYLKWLINQTK